jgi:cytochrome c oxidase subunit 3
MTERTLQAHFAHLEQQADAAKLGMWTFIAQEVLFFFGLFLTYAVMRSAYPQTFVAAHQKLSVVLGTLNTCVLLVSSFTMALAVRAARLGARKLLAILLASTAALGCGFLVIKGFEYADHIAHGQLPGALYTGRGIPGRPDIFFAFYFGMTGLHGLHVLIGIALLAWLITGALRGELVPRGDLPDTVDGVGLYWHFVDLIWIFLYPLLYLIR